MIFDCNIVSAQKIERVIRCVMDNNIELWKKVKEMKKEEVGKHYWMVDLRTHT